MKQLITKQLDKHGCFLHKFNPLKGRCPEDFHEIKDILCTPDLTQCVLDEEDHGQWRHPYAISKVNAQTSMQMTSLIMVLPRYVTCSK
jgi:hypothetical protein